MTQTILDEANMELVEARPKQEDVSRTDKADANAKADSRR
jgi:hypothetical protein